MIRDGRDPAGPLALALALLACAPASAPAPPQAGRHLVTAGRLAMGTVLEVDLVVADPERGRAVMERLFALAAELESLFTTWKADSALNRLSAAAGRGPQAVDPRLARILGDAVAQSRATDGAFDVTIGPLVDLWTAAARRNAPPTAAELAAAGVRVGFEKILVDGDRVELTAPDVRLNLGAIAKGWALDRMAEVLDEEGIADALLSFGQSSVLARGRPRDAPAWGMALRDGSGGVAGLVSLRDRALSVSGTLGQWSEIGGVRYGHVIDPRTGRALTRNLQAAVVARSAAEAEAWSTALGVLGEAGLARLEARPGLEAWLAIEPGGTYASSGWRAAVSFEPLPSPAAPGAHDPSGPDPMARVK